MWLRSIFFGVRSPQRSAGTLPALRMAIATLLLGSTLARADLKVGDTVPELTSVGLSSLGSTDKLPELRGKVVLVDFWASWCAPCKASFPAMGKLHSEYATRGVAIIAVSVDDERSAAAGFWKKMAAPFQGAHDAEKKLVSAVGVPTMPSSYVLDRDGRVRFVHEGFHGDSSERELRKEFETLLAEKTPTP
jgi:thiol-disulfide isomerase/thioredoxin